MSLHDVLLAKAFGNGSGSGVNVTAEVGQTIVVEEVDANGKPTKWKAAEYPLTVNEIIPQTAYTPVYDSSYSAYAWSFDNNTKLKSGQTYTILFDGVGYTCTAKRATVGNKSVTYIGNSVLDGDNTGEPFALLSVTGYDGKLVMFNFDGNEHIVSLSDLKVADCYVPDMSPLYLDVTILSNALLYTSGYSAASIATAIESDRHIIGRCTGYNTGYAVEATPVMKMAANGEISVAFIFRDWMMPENYRVLVVSGNADGITVQEWQDT